MTAQQYNQLPTIVNQERIQQLVEPLKSIPDFSSSALCVLTRDSETTCLSSLPELTIHLQEKGFFRGDILFDDRFYQENRVIFPNEYANQDQLQRTIKSICESYNVYRAYCITRNCPDCSLIATFNLNKPISDCKEVYENSIDDFEDFVVNFMDGCVDIYANTLPSIKLARFVTDSKYRETILRKRDGAAIVKTSLTTAEVEILYWAASGKTASEIAVILDFSENTITTYRQRAIQKLGASNLTHAVHLASLRGFIP